MKNLVLACLLIASLSSCITEYTCSCSGGGIDAFQTDINAATQSDADDQCAQTEANAEAANNGVDITCLLQ